MADARRAARMDLRPEAAEAVGVFALVFAGCGAIMTNAQTGALGHTGVALTFGLIILVMIYALGHVSGAHFNPAITVAFAATGHFPWRRVPSYALAQVAGAILGAAALRLVLGSVADVGATVPAPGLAVPAAFALEAVATFFLALVIIGVATDRRAAPGIAGLAIGFTVALDALFAGPLTGASMNPARTLGPALVSGTWTDAWLYMVAPALGAVLAMALYEWLRKGHVPKAGEPLGALGPFRLAPDAPREADAK